MLMSSDKKIKINMQKLKLPPHQQQRGNSIEKYEKNSIHKSKSKKLKKK